MGLMEFIRDLDFLKQTLTSTMKFIILNIELKFKTFVTLIINATVVGSTPTRGNELSFACSGNKTELSSATRDVFKKICEKFETDRLKTVSLCLCGIERETKKKTNLSYNTLQLSNTFLYLSSSFRRVRNINNQRILSTSD